jgi:hypothetical protein
MHGGGARYRAAGCRLGSGRRHWGWRISAAIGKISMGIAALTPQVSASILTIGPAQICIYNEEPVM